MVIHSCAIFGMTMSKDKQEPCDSNCSHGKQFESINTSTQGYVKVQ